MKAVVDANALFSCLLKDGLARKLWFKQELELYSPDFLMLEFLKYRQYLLQKSLLSETDFNAVFEKLFAKITVVPKKDLTAFIPAAATLSNDSKDWPYLACALKEDAIIWSEDKEFKKQKRVGVKTTSELGKETGLL